MHRYNGTNGPILEGANRKSERASEWENCQMPRECFSSKSCMCLVGSLELRGLCSVFLRVCVLWSRLCTFFCFRVFYSYVMWSLLCQQNLPEQENQRQPQQQKSTRRHFLQICCWSVRGKSRANQSGCSWFIPVKCVVVRCQWWYLVDSEFL